MPHAKNAKGAKSSGEFFLCDLGVKLFQQAASLNAFRKFGTKEQRNRMARASRIPKGFRPPAQGCEERATLGHRGQSSQPQRGCVPRGAKAATPLGLLHGDAGSQGSSFLALLGFDTESGWDSGWEYPNGIAPISRVIICLILLLSGWPVHAADPEAVTATGVKGSLCVVVPPSDAPQLTALSCDGRFVVQGLAPANAVDAIRAKIPVAMSGLVSV